MRRDFLIVGNFYYFPTYFPTFSLFPDQFPDFQFSSPDSRLPTLSVHPRQAQISLKDQPIIYKGIHHLIPLLFLRSCSAAGNNISNPVVARSILISTQQSHISNSTDRVSYHCAKPRNFCQQVGQSSSSRTLKLLLNNV